MRLLPERQKVRKLLFSILLLWGIFCAFPASALAQRGGGAHRHPRNFDAMAMVASEIKIVRTNPNQNAKKEDTARGREYEAFSVYEEGSSGGGYRIFLAERKTKKTYEIRGIPLEHRPFSDLVWVNNHTLVFDRWANPHHGSHYEVDARARKLKRALIFNDADER